MRRRKLTTALFVLLLPTSVLGQNYDAVPVAEQMRPRSWPSPVSSSRQSPRGYQPPPRPLSFEPPRSRFNSAPAVPFNGQIRPADPIPSFARPSINWDQKPRQVQMPMSWQFQQLQQQHPQRFQSKFGSAPAVQPTGNSWRTRKPTFEGPLDPVNNIIIHLYLNGKDKQSHSELRPVPVHGLFGIETSHGGPGSHADPIVITKDFDRDTLEFVESKKANAMMQAGPANIVEVRAMVSSPRKIEHTLSKAVNTELDRAIPTIMNRMRGGRTTGMDDDLRKELEEALVDELAKNLGDTIDNTEVTEEDLAMLIEEGFNDVNAQQTSTSPSTASQTTTTTTRHKTTAPTTKSFITTTRATTEKPPTQRKTTTTTTTTGRVGQTNDNPPVKMTPPPRTWRVETTTSAANTKLTALSTKSDIVKSSTTTLKPTSVASTNKPTTRTIHEPVVITKPWWESMSDAITTSTTTTKTKSAMTMTTPIRITTMPKQTLTTKPWWELMSDAMTTTSPTPKATTVTAATRMTRTTKETTEKTTPYYSTDTSITKYGLGNHIFIIPGFKPKDAKEDEVTEQTSTIWSTRSASSTSTAAPLMVVTTTRASSFADHNMLHVTDLDLNFGQTPKTPQVHVPTIGDLPEKPNKEMIQVLPARVAPTLGVITLNSDEEDTSSSEAVTSASISIINHDLSLLRKTTTNLEISTPSSTSTTSRTTTVIRTSTGVFPSTIAVNTDIERKTTNTGNEDTVPFATDLTWSQPDVTTITSSTPHSTTTTSRPRFLVTRPQPSSFGEENMMNKETDLGKLVMMNSEEEQITQASISEESEISDITSETTTSVSRMPVAVTIALPESTETGQDEEDYNEFDALRELIPGLNEHKETTKSVEYSSESVSETISGHTAFLPTIMSTRVSVTARNTTLTLSTNSQATTLKSIVEKDDIYPLPETVVLNSAPCPTPNNRADMNRSDVLFLLDSSNAFNEEKFQRAVDLILDTVDQFSNFGPDGMQVSLVQYNDEPYLEFSLRKHNCKKFLMDDISDTEYMAGGNKLGKALSKVSQFAYTKKRGDRADADNVLIIVSDGQTDDRIQEPIQLAREQGVTVLVISTIEANPDYISQLASHKSENMFSLDNDPHPQLAWKIARRITKSHSTSAASFEQLNSATSEENGVKESTRTSSSSSKGKLSTRRPFIEKNASAESNGVVHLKCVAGGFKIVVTPPRGFKGVAMVKGFGDEARCKSTAPSHGNISMFIANEECGVTQIRSLDPRGLNSSLVLHLLHDKDIVTGEDRAYLLQCFVSLPDDSELSTNLNIVHSELTIAETISLSTVPPSCTYSIRGGSPKGPILTKAVVGQTIYHRWDCDGTSEVNNVYGIQVHSCYASGDVERRFAFVDGRGCSSDLALLSDPTYSNDALSAYAASHVFGIGNAESLKFVCKLSLCTRDGDGCEGVTPPTCVANQSDLLLTRRLIRHQNSTIEGALTSALSTRVGLASNDAPFEGALSTLVGNKIFWIIGAATLVAIVAIAVMTKYPSEMGSSTCSTPPSPSLIDSQESRSISSMEDVLAPRNGRLAEFLQTFDRSRYV